MSPLTPIVNVCVEIFGSNVTVPVGKAPPKSAALAGSVPMPAVT